MWLWPLTKPWEYSPLGYVLAVAWNITEILGIKMPYPGWCFGKIIGVKGKRG